MRSRTLRAPLALVAVLALAGCASHAPHPQLLESQINPEKLALAKMEGASIFAGTLLTAELTQANVNLCKYKGTSSPFDVLTSPPFKGQEMRAAFVHAGLPSALRLLSVHKSADALEDKHIVQIGESEVGPADLPKAFNALGELLRASKPIPLVFSDGTRATVTSVPSCGGMMGVVNGTGYPSNAGLGIELLSGEWMALAKTRDESLFLVGRALYFVADEGADKLNNGHWAGAVVRGVLKAATFGLAPLAGDAKQGVIHMVRARYLVEADAFGMRAAVGAGANPSQILIGAKRMAADISIPWAELHFANGRIEAPEALAAQLEAANPAPLGTVTVVSAATNRAR